MSLKQNNSEGFIGAPQIFFFLKSRLPKPRPNINLYVEYLRALIWFFEESQFAYKASVKRATKNIQLVMQHYCKTSWKAMLCVLPLSSKPVNNLICCRTGLMWVVKRGTWPRNSFCSNVANQVACFFFVARFFFYPYLKTTKFYAKWPELNIGQKHELQ